MIQHHIALYSTVIVLIYLLHQFRIRLVLLILIQIEPKLIRLFHGFLFVVHYKNNHYMILISFCSSYISYFSVKIKVLSSDLTVLNRFY